MSQNILIIAIAVAILASIFTVANLRRRQGILTPVQHLNDAGKAKISSRPKP